MLKYLQKLLVIVSFLSTNKTYQKYKKLFLEWLSRKIESKSQSNLEEEKEMASVYPEKLPVDSVVYLVNAVRTGTLDDNAADAVYHGYLVLGYLAKVTVGEPSFIDNFSAEPVDLEALVDLYELENYAPRFGTDEPVKVNITTIMMIIQGIISLLQALGVIKKSSTNDVID